MLQVVVSHIGHRIQVPLEPEILIGRKDESSGVFPLVDLTPYGAAEKGVSRRHAKIVFRSDELTIEDIGSVNGTFLNGHRIVPYQSVPLSSGDVVQLGTLILQIYFDLPDPAEGSFSE
jgi:pSer/pThr/pTyr-binding forkhead associated (FHA) protein